MVIALFCGLTIVNTIAGCIFPLITDLLVTSYKFCQSFWGQQNYCALLIEGAGEIITEIMDVVTQL